MRPRGSATALRLWHGRLGMLVAPSVLFFSLTGAVQLLNLHESHAGYRASPLLVGAAAIHKEQALPEKPERDRSDRPAPRYSAAQAILKGYWILVAAALVASTVIGVVLGLRGRVQRRTNLALLAAGCVIPLALALA